MRGAVGVPLSFGVLVLLLGEGAWGRQLQAAKGWDPHAKTCTRKLQGAKQGCDLECPRNSCVKDGVKCVKDFTDCECQPGYFKLRGTRYSTPKVSFTGSGTKEGRRIQDRVGQFVAGELGHCVASHGRSQMDPTYYKRTKLHTKTPYLPQTIFTSKMARKRLGYADRNIAFRVQATSK